MPTVADASPLIFYARIDGLSLLQRVFGEILIPAAVWDEIMTGQGTRPGAAAIASARWIQQRPLAQPLHPSSISPQIDMGEAEAIELALELGIDTTFISDDARARSLAMARGLTVIGSAGTVIVAKRRGLIEYAVPVLDELRSVGLFLSDEVLREIVSSVDE